MAKKKATPTKATEQFPGVYLTEVPRVISFGRSSIGPATNLRPGGAHKQAPLDSKAPVISDFEE